VSLDPIEGEIIMNLTICMATYNGATYIREQIDSILVQMKSVDVLLIADDGSTDGTLAIIESYSNDARVVLVATSRVGSIVRNFERILAKVESDGVVLSDQDDVWLPGRLDIIREALKTKSMVLLNGEIVDANLSRSGISIFDSIGVRSGFFPNLYKNSYIGCCMAFRRDLLIFALPFPPLLPWHDWYLGLLSECLKSTERIYVKTILYRRHGQNFSNTGGVSSNSIIKKLNIRICIIYGILVALFRNRFRSEMSQ
jgi:glycosyltransferase involved in cell wall biosynthesis